MATPEPGGAGVVGAGTGPSSSSKPFSKTRNVLKKLATGTTTAGQSSSQHYQTQAPKVSPYAAAERIGSRSRSGSRGGGLSSPTSPGGGDDAGTRVLDPNWGTTGGRGGRGTGTGLGDSAIPTTTTTNPPNPASSPYSSPPPIPASNLGGGGGPVTDSTDAASLISNNTNNNNEVTASELARDIGRLLGSRFKGFTSSGGGGGTSAPASAGAGANDGVGNGNGYRARAGQWLSTTTTGWGLGGLSAQSQAQSQAQAQAQAPLHPSSPSSSASLYSPSYPPSASIQTVFPGPATTVTPTSLTGQTQAPVVSSHPSGHGPTSGSGSGLRAGSGGHSRSVSAPHSPPSSSLSNNAHEDTSMLSRQTSGGSNTNNNSPGLSRSRPTFTRAGQQTYQGRRSSSLTREGEGRTRSGSISRSGTGNGTEVVRSSSSGGNRNVGGEGENNNNNNNGVGRSQSQSTSRSEHPFQSLLPLQTTATNSNQPPSQHSQQPQPQPPQSQSSSTYGFNNLTSTPLEQAASLPSSPTNNQNHLTRSSGSVGTTISTTTGRAKWLASRLARGGGGNVGGEGGGGGSASSGGTMGSSSNGLPAATASGSGSGWGQNRRGRSSSSTSSTNFGPGSPITNTTGSGSGSGFLARGTSVTGTGKNGNAGKRRRNSSGSASVEVGWPGGVDAWAPPDAGGANVDAVALTGGHSQRQKQQQPESGSNEDPPSSSSSFSRPGGGGGGENIATPVSVPSSHTAPTTTSNATTDFRTSVATVGTSFTAGTTDTRTTNEDEDWEEIARAEVGGFAPTPGGNGGSNSGGGVGVGKMGSGSSRFRFKGRNGKEVLGRWRKGNSSGRGEGSEGESGSGRNSIVGDNNRTSQFIRDQQDGEDDIQVGSRIDTDLSEGQGQGQEGERRREDGEVEIGEGEEEGEEGPRMVVSEEEQIRRAIEESEREERKRERRIQIEHDEYLAALEQSREDPSHPPPPFRPHFHPQSPSQSQQGPSTNTEDDPELHAALEQSRHNARFSSSSRPEYYDYDRPPPELPPRSRTPSGPQPQSEGEGNERGDREGEGGEEEEDDDFKRAVEESKAMARARAEAEAAEREERERTPTTNRAVAQTDDYDQNHLAPPPSSETSSRFPQLADPSLERNPHSRHGPNYIHNNFYSTLLASHQALFDRPSEATANQSSPYSKEAEAGNLWIKGDQPYGWLPPGASPGSAQEGWGRVNVEETEREMFDMALKLSLEEEAKRAERVRLEEEEKEKKRKEGERRGAEERLSHSRTSSAPPLPPRDHASHIPLGLTAEDEERRQRRREEREREERELERLADEERLSHPSLHDWDNLSVGAIPSTSKAWIGSTMASNGNISAPTGNHYQSFSIPQLTQPVLTESGASPTSLGSQRAARKESSSDDNDSFYRLGAQNQSEPTSDLSTPETTPNANTDKEPRPPTLVEPEGEHQLDDAKLASPTSDLEPAGSKDENAAEEEEREQIIHQPKPIRPGMQISPIPLDDRNNPIPGLEDMDFHNDDRSMYTITEQTEPSTRMQSWVSSVAGQEDDSIHQGLGLGTGGAGRDSMATNGTDQTYHTARAPKQHPPQPSSSPRLEVPGHIQNLPADPEERDALQTPTPTRDGARSPNEAYFGDGVRVGRPSHCSAEHVCLADGLHRPSPENPFPHVIEVSNFPAGASTEEDIGTDVTTFALEAETWAALLRFLMWYGDSRVDSSHRDRMAEDSRHPGAAMALEFRRDEAGLGYVRLLIRILPPNRPLSTSDFILASDANRKGKGKAKASPVYQLVTLPDHMVLPTSLNQVAVTLYSLRQLASIARSTQASKEATDSYRSLRVLGQAIDGLAKEREPSEVDKPTRERSQKDDERLLHRLRARLGKRKDKEKEKKTNVAEITGAGPRVSGANGDTHRVIQKPRPTGADQLPERTHEVSREERVLGLTDNDSASGTEELRYMPQLVDNPLSIRG